MQAKRRGTEGQSCGLLASRGAGRSPKFAGVGVATERRSTAWWLAGAGLLEGLHEAASRLGVASRSPVSASGSAASSSGGLQQRGPCEDQVSTARGKRIEGFPDPVASKVGLESGQAVKAHVLARP